MGALSENRPKKTAQTFITPLGDLAYFFPRSLHLPDTVDKHIVEGHPYTCARAALNEFLGHLGCWVKRIITAAVLELTWLSKVDAFSANLVTYLCFPNYWPNP